MGAMEANFQSFLHRNHHLCLKIQLKGVTPRLAYLMVNPPLPFLNFLYSLFLNPKSSFKLSAKGTYQATAT
jgi:hypothetical protein